MGAADRLQLGGLPFAQSDDQTGALPQTHRHREVVAVVVRDEALLEVVRRQAQLTQRVVERPLRDLDLPPAVDEGVPVLAEDGVDVDRLEPVHRQGKGDPVHPGGDLFGSRGGPVMGRALSHVPESSTDEGRGGRPTPT